MLMPFADTKIYYDGSHYIAIPHTKRPNMKYREQTVEELITVKQQVEGSETDKVDEPFMTCPTSKIEGVEETTKNINNEPKIGAINESQPKEMTKKQLFDKLYMEHIDLPKKERAYKIMEEMLPYFDSIEELKWYVDLGIERKKTELNRKACKNG